MTVAELDLATAHSGHCFNLEEKATLSFSLVILKDSQQFQHCQLWGKILGVQKDYLIAFCHHDDPLARKFFYSLDRANWLQMPDISAKEEAKLKSISKRFLGDPAFEYHASPAIQDANVAGTDASDEELVVLSEEKRLATVVLAITQECWTVPRGAYHLDAVKKIRLNPLFSGLRRYEAKQALSYLHFKRSSDALKVVSQMRKDVEQSIDIFVPIANDEPKGCWSIQGENGDSVVVIKSLRWPGYCAHHVPETATFGGIYIGTGQKNSDLGYEL